MYLELVKLVLQTKLLPKTLNRQSTEDRQTRARAGAGIKKENSSSSVYLEYFSRLVPDISSIFTVKHYVACVYAHISCKYPLII